MERSVSCLYRLLLSVLAILLIKPGYIIIQAADFAEVGVLLLSMSSVLLDN